VVVTLALAVGVRCWGQIKHDLEMIGPAYREVDVAAAAEFKPLDRGFSGASVFCISRVRRSNPSKSYSGKQVIPAVEVTVGSIVGDAGTARDLAQSESAGADLADKGYGGFEKRVA